MGVRAVERQLRRRIVKQYPPKYCTAMSKSTGERCRQFAMVAAVTCQKHGSMAKQVREAVQTRVTLADAMVHGARRSPRAILADAGHLSDHLMRQAIAAIDQVSEPVSVDLVDQLTAAIGRAQHIAKINVDLGIDQSSLDEALADQVLGTLLLACELLKIPLSERKVRRALREAMRAVDEIGGSDAAARAAYLDRESSRLLALLDVTEVKHPPPHEVRHEHLAELRLQAALGRCRCCDALPGQRHLSAPLAIEAPTPDPDAPPSQRPTQPPDGAPERDVIVAELVDDPPAPRALPRWPACPGCGRLRDPSHEATCGYALASAYERRGTGR